MTALEHLLTGLIDYAGLFPPANLGIEAAVRSYDSYRRGAERWILGRLIIPAARLPEYEDTIRNAGIDASAWSLSVLASPADAERLAGFNTSADDRGGGGCGSIDVLELKANSTREIQDAAAAFSRKYQLYIEVPLDKAPSLLPAIGVARARAKIRTGGEVPGAIPESSRVLSFLRTASERRLAFKATAGLHHPLRGMQRLTYQPDSPTATMHGFLNVFCAAVLLWHEPKQAQEAAWLLDERDPSAITMTENEITWHSSGVVLTAEQIHRARQEFAIAFGSCSFTEPIDDLRTLGWL